MTSHSGPSGGTGVSASRDTQNAETSGAPGGAMSSMPPGMPQSHSTAPVSN